jgi:hypothetical protein
MSGAISSGRPRSGITRERVARQGIIWGQGKESVPGGVLRTDGTFLLSLVHPRIGRVPGLTCGKVAENARALAGRVLLQKLIRSMSRPDARGDGAHRLRAWRS